MSRNKEAQMMNDGMAEFLAKKAANNYGIDFHGVEKSEHGTMLFKVDLGGCEAVWVSAANHVRAIMIAAEHDAFDGLPHDDSIEVTLPRRRVLREGTFSNDDGSKSSLWDEWQRDTSERFVASTVW